MACENKKCFTVIWKLENASFSSQDGYNTVKSPVFTVDEIHKTNWKLELDVSGAGILLFLDRQDKKIVEDVEIRCEFAIIAADGTVSHAQEDVYTVDDCDIGTYYLASREEVFSAKSTFFPQDTFTTRCRIWKCEGEMSKNVQYFARTRIGVEKRSFLWDVEKFSRLYAPSKRTYEIKSLGNSNKLMSLELFLTGGMIYDETIHFKIIPCRENLKNFTFQASVVDASKNTMRWFQHEFLVRDPCDSKDFTLFYTKRELMEKKDKYLLNDTLSVLCDCTFSFGIELEEIEQGNCDCTLFKKKELADYCLLKENDLPAPESILIDNLKSMENSNFLSDVTLRTKSRTFAAHKFILSARSPVFKAMFSSNMTENRSDCVNIEDMNDDTVLHMLHYIYSAEVVELEWDIATKLYEAADKYQILSLRDMCSSYLKNNLHASNACESLILADMHHDQYLKGFVQDFILRCGLVIINSEEWGQLMESNLKLAAETMRLRYKV